jgi:hypothetical protein
VGISAKSNSADTFHRLFNWLTLSLKSPSEHCTPDPQRFDNRVIAVHFDDGAAVEQPEQTHVSDPSERPK